MVGNVGDFFLSGATLIVEPEMQPQARDYLKALNAKNETTVKQLVKDNGDLYLKPLNSHYPKKPSGNARIIGVLRKITKRLK